MTVLYNEIDAFACAWLRNAVDAALIAPGVVVERDIGTLMAEDVCGKTQAHFFAGIGVWSHALRLAGWPDDVPVWTGSCPCQPFSQAGRKRRFADARHLWPVWFDLIRAHRPPIIFGEQVASPDGAAWLDLVSANLEDAGYAFGAADLPAAGVGAPHIRQRLWFVAIAPEQGRVARRRPSEARDAGLGPVEPRRYGSSHGARRADGLADTDGPRLGVVGHAQLPDDILASLGHDAHGRGAAVELGDTCGVGGRGYAGTLPGAEGGGEGGRIAPGNLSDFALTAGTTGATRGFWDRCEWVYCRDGKQRPIEPGTQPLAHGAPTRVGRLRAYGNAIVAPLAATWIASVMDYLDLSPTPCNGDQHERGCLDALVER